MPDPKKDVEKVNKKLSQSGALPSDIGNRHKGGMIGTSIDKAKSGQDWAGASPHYMQKKGKSSEYKKQYDKARKNLSKGSNKKLKKVSQNLKKEIMKGVNI